MKIAVCLSGQPRTVRYTAKSIINYFLGDYEVDYFCHSWNYNTCKYNKTDPSNKIIWLDDEFLPIEQVYDDLLIFNPKGIEVYNKKELPTIFGGWESLFYSIMRANNLKKQYEIENKFRYDLVIRARFDTVYSPRKNFIIPNNFDDLDIFTTHNDRMCSEYNRINVSDVFFLGSSYGMDILCDIYRYVHSINMQRRIDDYTIVGPGVLIGDYCNMYNIRVSSLRTLGLNSQEVIYRKEMIPMDPILNFDTIQENHMSYYR